MDVSTLLQYVQFFQFIPIYFKVTGFYRPGPALP